MMALSNQIVIDLLNTACKLFYFVVFGSNDVPFVENK